MTEDGPVTVRLMQTPGGERVVRVQVRSRTRPSSLMSGLLKAGELGTAAEARKTVETLGGALAERLIDVFGDTVDPDEMARLAGRGWDELVEEARRAGQPPRTLN